MKDFDRFLADSSMDLNAKLKEAYEEGFKEGEKTGKRKKAKKEEAYSVGYNEGFKRGVEVTREEFRHLSSRFDFMTRHWAKNGDVEIIRNPDGSYTISGKES